MSNQTRRGYSLRRNTWGWDIEWYDGKGTYVTCDDLRWYEVPFGFLRLWLEVRRV